MAELYVPGRTFPVEVTYRPFDGDAYVPVATLEVRKVCLATDPGDVLVFLSGQDDIAAAYQALEGQEEELNCTLIQLHSKAPDDDRQRALRPDPGGRRKVLLATNAAETGVTIDGVRHVIDAGVAKETVYERGCTALRLRPISRSSAVQRAGRAGRTAPGCCYRLYSEEHFQAMEGMQTPEILRVKPISAVLKLKAIGIQVS